MTTKSIFGVLLSLDDDHLLLPNVAVLEVGNALDLAPGDGEDAWWCSDLDYDGRRVPLVDFTALNRGRAPTLSRARPVFVQMPEGCEPPVIALACRGHPHLIDVEPQALVAEPLEAADDADLLLCRARLGGTQVAIPNLKSLADELAVAAASRVSPPGALPSDAAAPGNGMAQDDTPIPSS